MLPRVHTLKFFFSTSAGHETVSAHHPSQAPSATHANLPYDNLFSTRQLNGRTPQWIFDDDQSLGPSYGVALTGQDQYIFSNDLFPDSDRPNFLTSSSFPMQLTFPSPSPDLSSFSMSPLLRGLSGGDSSPVCLGDTTLTQLFQEVNQNLSPNVPQSFPQGSPPLSPLTFAVSSDPLDSPGYQPLLLLQDDGGFPDLPIPSDLTIEVGSSVDMTDHYPHRRPASVLTTSSESIPGSCHSNLSPFSPNSHHLLYPSSPNTDYSSSASLMVPTNSRLQGGESTANNSEQVTTAHYPSTLNYPGPSHIHETRDSISPAVYPGTSRWLHNLGYEQTLERTPSTSSQSDIGSIDNGKVVPSGKPIASKASREASDKRRKKDAKYECTLCPQKLTSRDNLISESSIIRGVNLLIV